jgi:hypothetical protein
MLRELILSKSKLVPKIDGNFAHIVDLIKFYMMRKPIPSCGMDKDNKLLECFGEIKGKLFYFLWGVRKIRLFDSEKIVTGDYAADCG